MPRFSLEDVKAAQPADPAKMAATTDDDIVRQIASDPDTAPDMAHAPPGNFTVRRRFPEVRALRKRLGLTQEQFAVGFGVPSGWRSQRRFFRSRSSHVRRDAESCGKCSA